MKNFRRILPIIVLSILEFFALITIVRGVTVIPVPHFQNYGECIVFVNAWGLAGGHGLYRLSELDKLPMFFAAYPPIFYLLLAVGFKFWGISYVPGRTMALMATAGCAIFVALIARRRGCDNSSAISGGLAFLATWPLYIFGSYLRVDQLAALFELIAIYFLLGQKITARRAAFFVIFGVLAGYTKQTSFNLVLGALLGLMIEGDAQQRRRIFAVGCVYGLAAVSTFLIIEIMTGWSFHQFINPKINTGFSGVYFIERIGEIMRDPITPTIIVLGVISVIFEKRRVWIALFIGIPMAWGFRAVGIRGTSCNHFIEAMAACGVGLALLLNSMKKKSSEGRHLGIILVCLAIILFSFGSIYKGKRYLKSLWMMSSNFSQVIHPNSQPAIVISFMEKNIPPDSLVFSGHSDLPLFAGCQTAVSDILTITGISNFTGRQPEPLLDGLRNHNIKLVVMEEEVTTAKPMTYLSRDVAETILENYRHLTNDRLIYYYHLYVPK